MNNWLTFVILVAIVGGAAVYTDAKKNDIRPAFAWALASMLSGIGFVAYLFVRSNTKRDRDARNHNHHYNQPGYNPNANGHNNPGSGGFCPYCGAFTQPDGMFCRQCGKKVN